jgi:ribonucleoside-diphosphate reductase alpha chain
MNMEDQETYQELVEKFPQDLDWTRLDRFETRDNTTGAQELACAAGGCEII